jgi:parallel beta-helix repeat protein
MRQKLPLSVRVFFAKTFAVLGIGILLLTPLAALSNQGAEQNGTVGSSHLAAHAVGVQSRGVPHVPIHISGNEDFASQAANEGWIGDGSQDNPYIIEGYEIDGNGGAYCIWIENTTAWFVIRNCMVWNATNWDVEPNGVGIYLKKVQNAILSGIECYGPRVGLLLGLSNNNTITNNKCGNNSLYSICLSNSNNNTITNNTCSNNSVTVELYSSSNNTVANNTCTECSAGCVSMDGSNYNIISNNNGPGAYLSYSKNNIILDNNFFGGPVQLDSSDNNIIKNNNCSGNLEFGGRGMYIVDSNNNTILNNNCSTNSWEGICLAFSCKNIITNNTCSDNGGTGISIRDFSNNNTIMNNNCSSNPYGISIWQSNNNTITYNNISENTHYGIIIEKPHPFTKDFPGNSVNTDYGITISESTGNILHHNNFWQNNGAGKGVNGNCQAYDSAGGNAWYENTAHEGNYWSNWNGLGWGTPDAYPIQGATGAYDMYPLSHPAVVLRPPSAPQNLTVVAGNTTAILTWEPPADDGGTPITNYTIYYHTKTGGSPEKIVVGNITTYTFSGLTNGQTYYFAVSAINKASEGEKSNEVRATPCTTPSPPQNLTAVAGNRNVTLTWEPPADNGGMAVTNYTVYYGTSPGNYTNNITLGNITNYTITGLINGQRYYFAVSAINAVGESPKSNEVSAMPCTVPSAPQNLTAVAGDGNVTLTWQPPADDGGSPITGYKIYYGTSPSNYTTNITVGNITSYTITGLTNGQKYYFVVSAINGVGEGPWSNEVSATPTAEQQQPPGKTPGFDVLVGICAIAVSMAVIAIRRRKSR